ncbi:nuclear transport factor 2 family protein [Christiangramia sp. SM2212]|uniref:Nuclear transport factor 2 family protein n=1 Tax=Christiangramia sediminicola TaxID=3073267 RepID=A0ABU1ESE5_9FLAO|nr:nuclear transport factor 2 family protein [Christiangramia sp. SM2212]MDR5591318.1 nuclear transport factor 2 family protein [Christiangramia sp. SM2212]
MKKFLILFFALSLNSLDLISQEFIGDKNDIDIILKNTEAFSKAYVNADYDGIKESYAENAVILPPGAELIKGKQAIKERWILPEEVKILSHKITQTEIKIINDHAYDIGYYEGSTQRNDGTEISWKGKYLIVWKKEEGDWKIYADAWNQVE